MERDPTRTLAKPWLAVALSLAMLAGAARCVADDAPKTTPAGRLEDKAPLKPFDLSYVPDDIMGFIAFRPSATFRQQGMAPLAAQADTMLAMALRELGILTDPARNPFRVEAVEQVTLGLLITHVEGKKEFNRRIEAHGLMVRIAGPTDWRKLIQSRWPGLTECRAAGQVYYKAGKDHDRLRTNACFYIPDDRTLVLVDEPRLLRVLRRGVPTAPEYARGEDWDRVSRGLFAVALDNRDGRWTRAFQDSVAAAIAPSVKHAGRWIFGVNDTHALAFQAVATCLDAPSSTTTARAVEALLATCRQHLAQPEPDGPHAQEVPASRRKLADILARLRVEIEGATVAVRGDRLGTLADLVALIAHAD
jgi:hypothetical protein